MRIVNGVRAKLRGRVRNETLVLACEIVLVMALAVFVGRGAGHVLLGLVAAAAGASAVVLRQRARRANRRLLLRIDDRTKQMRSGVQPAARAAGPRTAAGPRPVGAAPSAGSAGPARVPGPEGAKAPASSATRGLLLDPTPSEVQWAVERQIVPRVVKVEDARHWYRPRRTEAATLRVAAICDEFTFNSFTPEAELVALRPDTWRQQMEEHQPDIFFCESAWAGVPSSERPWKGQIYASISFSYENRRVLLEILDHCKKQGIPTVFWNKEDPTHFADRITDFVATAALFDHILTTAEECVDDYRKLLRRGNVGLLPFAAQPTLFHPDPAVVRTRSAVFAGAWYGVHRQRAADMDKMFSTILDAGLPLVIHDRDFGLNDPQRTFPERFRGFVRPSVPHARTADVYRRHLLGVNVNTVTTSRTMCARRIFELAASGAAIVTNDSPAMGHFLPGGTISVDDLVGMTVDEIEAWHRDTWLTNLERVLRDHTYSRRLADVCEQIGLEQRSPFDALARVQVVSNHDEARQAVSHVGRGYDEVLVVVGKDVPTHEVGEYYTRYIGSHSAVVSQRLLADGFVDPRSLLGVRLAHVTRGGASELDVAEATRLALHAQYTGSPVTRTDGPDLVWAAHHDGDAIVNAADLADALVRTEPITSLGVPAR